MQPSLASCINNIRIRLMHAKETVQSGTKYPLLNSMYNEEDACIIRDNISGICLTSNTYNFFVYLMMDEEESCCM